MEDSLITPVDRSQVEGVDRAQKAAPNLPTAALVERIEYTPDLMVIKLKPEKEFTFKPGQYCTLGLDGIERAYSIVSAPEEDLLEIFVELVPVPDGVLTPRLWEIKPGGHTTMRPRAKGIFTLDQHYNQHLMVATVTGIAPYISIIRSYFLNGLKGHKFYVLHGASYEDELVYKDEIEALAQTYPDTVAYLATVSRPQDQRNANWNGTTGRVNANVEDWITHLGLNSQSTLVYACGHPDMIEDVKTRLIPHEYKIKEERFWKQ